MNMPTTPTVLVASQEYALSQKLRRLLENEGYHVILASSAEDAYAIARQEGPAVVLAEVTLPSAGGFTLSEWLRDHQTTRSLPVLLLLSTNDAEERAHVFESGADDYLLTPFTAKELRYRLSALLGPARMPRSTAPPTRRIARVIDFFAGKGGVGNTTLAVNSAVALKAQTDARVLLVDADFFFGDVGTHLDLPSQDTILDLIDYLDEVDTGFIDQVVQHHASGIDVLLPPKYPEHVEIITPDDLIQVMNLLAERYDLILVDCYASYDERMLTLLKYADRIMLVTTPEISALRNASNSISVMDKLGVPGDIIDVILNRSNSNLQIDADRIERVLQRPVQFHVVSSGEFVVESLTRGVPMVLERPTHRFSVQVTRIAEHLRDIGRIVL